MEQLRIELQTKNSKLNNIQIYAPTAEYSVEEIEQFGKLKRRH